MPACKCSDWGQIYVQMGRMHAVLCTAECSFRPVPSLTRSPLLGCIQCSTMAWAIEWLSHEEKALKAAGEGPISQFFAAAMQGSTSQLVRQGCPSLPFPAATRRRMAWHGMAAPL